MSATSFTAKYFHVWEAVPEERRQLGLLIGAAAFVHLVLFFSVRLAAPPEAGFLSAAPPREVLTIAPQAASGEGDSSFWSQIDDPSLVVYPPDFLTLAGTHPALAQPVWPDEAPGETTTVALSPDLQFLPDRLPPLPERARADLAAASPAAQSFQFSLHPVFSLPTLDRTAVTWSEALAARAPKAWDLPAAPGGILAESGVTVLSLCVDASGAVVHALVEQSAGRAEVDALALDAARKLRFEPKPGAHLVWGRATVFWKFTSAPQ